MSVTAQRRIRRTRTRPGIRPGWCRDYDTVKRLGRSHPEPDVASRYSESVIFGRAQPTSPTEAADHSRMPHLVTGPKSWKDPG